MNEIRKHYHKSLAELEQEVLRMGAFVEESLRKAMKALSERDEALAQSVISGDDTINNLELEIQDRCTIMLATEQPVAGDLRHIITSLKIISQLERMGDHAVHIAKAVKRINGESLIKPLIDLPKMAEIGAEMVHEALSAYADGNSEKAVEVAQRDEAIDELHDQVWRELLTHMMEDTHSINQATTLLFVSRWLERFGDHATNISEWVVYDCTGNHVELNL